MKTLTHVPVEKYMTSAPITIGSEVSLAKAEKMMAEHRIRHLPVLSGGRLVGVISDRDIKAVETFKDVDPEKVTVSEALIEDAYTVSPKAPLAAVCKEMAQHKYGSVLVVDSNRLVGILTWVDALKAVGDLFSESQLHL